MVALTIALFNIIDIDLKDTLWHGAVVWPLTGAAFATGIGITRTREYIIHSMRLLLLALVRALLPLHLLVTATFCGFVLWRGPDNLDARFSVTFVLLAAIALALTLCSAAIGDKCKTTGSWVIL